MLSTWLENPGFGKPQSLTLTSAAFGDGEPVPERNSCYGRDLSPALAWSNPHPDNEVYALVMVATGGISEEPWIHWVFWDLPEQQTDLPEGANVSLYRATVGRNSWGRAQYDGPFPKAGQRDYAFYLYCLDGPISLEPGTNAVEAIKALEPHVLSWGVVRGTYTAPPGGRPS